MALFVESLICRVGEGLSPEVGPQAILSTMHPLLFPAQRISLVRQVAFPPRQTFRN